MLLFDAHLDISMNATEWNRDLTRPLEEIRNRNALMLDKLDRGKGILTFEEIRKGEIGICIATQIDATSLLTMTFPAGTAPRSPVR